MSSKWLYGVSVVSVLAMTAGCGKKEETTAPAPAPAQEQQAAPAAPAGEQPAAAPAEGGAPAYEVAPVTGGGKVTGKVTFQGAAPAAEEIEVTKDANVCGTTKKGETMMVSAEGNLGNVVVWIEGINKGKAWPAATDGKIDQKDCHYLPHIQALASGAKLSIVNSDPVLHNIHAYSNGETLFNIAQPTQGQSTDKKLNQTGPIEFKCDVHSWMHAWIFVAGNPYFAVTDDKGTFDIGDVPAGTYKVKAWHEKLGTKEMDVTVAAGGAGTADFAFSM